jgi:acetoin utilization deacetylase AcuC-like enzyme
MEELDRGLRSHRCVAKVLADTDEQETLEVLSALHDEDYLDALWAVAWEEPRIVAEWAPPGLPADSPVWPGIVDAAKESARTAVTAARLLAAGERFTYALCRPPGHHAGPRWMGGYCYLNTAAAAAWTLCERGLGPVTVVDVDFHFPTGTQPIVARNEQLRLLSLHASTTQQVPWREVSEGERERFVAFDSTPSPDEYLDALHSSIAQVAADSNAVVLSLGYDTVQQDPHGTWAMEPEFFASLARELANCELPICVVQEGGYALSQLASCSAAFAEGLLDGDVR